MLSYGLAVVVSWLSRADLEWVVSGKREWRTRDPLNDTE
jgi:hypothetical protein